MKKLIAGIALTLAAATPVLTLCSCKNNTENKPKTFGEFSYNGKYLTEYAAKEITANEAKAIINKKAAYASTSSFVVECDYIADTYNVSEDIINAPKPSESLVTSVVQSYGKLTTTTKYYVPEGNEAKEKVDELTGAEFKLHLQKNEITPFNQLVAKNLLMFDELIDFMEQENENFKNSSTVAPFRNIFTYHTDGNDNLIIQTRDFAEIASSVGGGIGCNYRQDTEIVYDSELKISKWQTSLGVTLATPNGTVKQGYILEVDFDWDEIDK